jgi:hypothetical protein
MGQNTLSTTVRYRATDGIPLGVGDLAVVDHDGVSLRPVAASPADALAEFRAVV